jgi:hypothetical protein
MNVVIIILRICIVLLGLVGLLAGLNSLPFPGVGIFIAIFGFSLFLWRMTIILKSSPAALALNKKYFMLPAWIFMAGIIIGKVGERFL